jgi:hypothetical protein
MRGFVLIAFGILYLMKPNLFQSGIFMKYPNAASMKTPEQYRKHMQKIAIILIVIGSLLLAYDYRNVLMSTSSDKVTVSELLSLLTLE